MANTAIVGLTGSISMPGLANQLISQVSILTGAELLDVSSYGGPGWRQRVCGIKDLSGSAVGFLSEGASGTNPFTAPTTSGTMTIVFQSGCQISFNAVIGNIQIVGQYQGLNITTFNWSYDDTVAPTVSWIVS